jgi:hypothetical protein
MDRRFLLSKVWSGCLTNESLDIKTPTRDFPIEKVPMSKVKRFELISSDASAIIVILQQQKFVSLAAQDRLHRFLLFSPLSSALPKPTVDWPPATVTLAVAVLPSAKVTVRFKVEPGGK